MSYLLRNGKIVNEGSIKSVDILIKSDIIERIEKCGVINEDNHKVIDLFGKYILPGVIDPHVHFREPGLTHKADIYTESMAAVAGGVTSYLEMPNTKPATVTKEALYEKLNIASQKSFANYGFYFGASNDNIEVVKSLDFNDVAGVKVFLGSSTGNMLVDNNIILEKIFSEIPKVIAIHSEDEAIIKHNTEEARKKYGDDAPFDIHPIVRSEEACFKSTLKAVELAKKFNTRLHILHTTTAKELQLLSDEPLSDKLITAEVCTPHLWFTKADFETKKGLIKCNPSIKEETDREALRKAFKLGYIDVVGTDHAPHTIEEKTKGYFDCPSGMPSVQHLLNIMLELVIEDYFDFQDVPYYTAHNVADCFGIKDRGYLREGYKADLTVVDMLQKTFVQDINILYKCGWSPFEGTLFNSKIISTFVNGKLVYDKGKIITKPDGKQLEFRTK